MLVLTRRKLETVEIDLGDGRIGRVVVLSDDRVKLAFDFPGDMRIRRGELPEGTPLFADEECRRRAG